MQGELRNYEKGYGGIFEPGMGEVRSEHGFVAVDNKVSLKTVAQ